MLAEPQLALGKAIRWLREQGGMTQAVLASDSGVSASRLSGIEAGKVDPSWGTVRQVAEGLGVSLETLAEVEAGFEEPTD